MGLEAAVVRRQSKSGETSISRIRIQNVYLPITPIFQYLRTTWKSADERREALVLWAALRIALQDFVQKVLVQPFGQVIGPSPVVCKPNFVNFRSKEFHPTEVRIAEVRPTEVRIANASATEICSKEFRRLKVDRIELCVSEIRYAQIGSGEIRKRNLCSSKIGFLKVGRSKIGPHDFNALKVGSTEISIRSSKESECRSGHTFVWRQVQVLQFVPLAYHKFNGPDFAKTSTRFGGQHLPCQSHLGFFACHSFLRCDLAFVIPEIEINPEGDQRDRKSDQRDRKTDRHNNSDDVVAIQPVCEPFEFIGFFRIQVVAVVVGHCCPRDPSSTRFASAIDCVLTSRG